MHDSSVCPICSRFSVAGTLSDEEFFAFLDVCRRELATKQLLFQQRIAGCDRWFYDLADNSLTMGHLRFAITAIGTWSPEYQTWLWAWANPDYPTIARDASRKLQSLFDTTGFRVFVTEGIDASSTDAQDFAALAIHQLDGIGFFRCPSKGPTLYLAVHDTMG